MWKTPNFAYTLLMLAGLLLLAQCSYLDPDAPAFVRAVSALGGLLAMAFALVRLIQVNSGRSEHDDEDWPDWPEEPEELEPEEPVVVMPPPDPEIRFQEYKTTIYTPEDEHDDLRKWEFVCMIRQRFHDLNWIEWFNDPDRTPHWAAIESVHRLPIQDTINKAIMADYPTKEEFDAYIRSELESENFKDVRVTQLWGDKLNFSSASATEATGVLIGKRPNGTPVWLPDRLRERDFYIIGTKRSGKSTLALNVAVQDINAGKGVIFIDHQADNPRELLKCIPGPYADRVIYFDPAHAPIPIDLFEAQTPGEQKLVAKNVATMFRRTAPSVGDVMQIIIEQGFLTLADTQNPKFSDLLDMVSNPEFLQFKLDQLKDKNLRKFWDDVYKTMLPASKQAVRSRLLPFSQPPLSQIFSVANPALKMSDVLNNRMIFIADLSGLAGDEQVVGSMLLSLIQLEANRRDQIKDKSARVPSYVFIDEFPNYIGDGETLEKLLSECGKYHIHLTLIHQYLAQANKGMSKAITSNIDTAVIFKIDPTDGFHLSRYLGHGETKMKLDDIAALNFDKRETIVCLNNETFKMYATATRPPYVSHDWSKWIKDTTKTKYSGKTDTPDVPLTHEYDDDVKPSVPKDLPKKGRPGKGV